MAEEHLARLAFSIEEADAGMRLDHFLARAFPQHSLVILRRATAEGRVRVNGAPSRSTYRLRAGDLVTVEIDPTPTPAFLPEPIPLHIVFEDESVLIVEKPAGMLVHPTRHVTSGTLLNALCSHLFPQRARPGLVHRLDRLTSGLMLIAKTEAAHRVLARHFREHRILKKYLALVHGEVHPDALQITLPIGWDPHRYPHWSVQESGREAITEVRVLERLRGLTVIEAHPRTGRTHQIRIHLAAIGHPVLGDALYGREAHASLRSWMQHAGMSVERHFLHASELAFHHPRTGQWLHFSSPAPEDFRALLDRWRASCSQRSSPETDQRAADLL